MSKRKRKKARVVNYDSMATDWKIDLATEGPPTVLALIQSPSRGPFLWIGNENDGRCLGTIDGPAVTEIARRLTEALGGKTGSR